MRISDWSSDVCSSDLIGLVLLLATSWPAYQILVYDIILHPPAEPAATIGGAANQPGSGGGLVDRIDAVDQALKMLAIEGVGPVPLGAHGQPALPSVPPPPSIQNGRAHVRTPAT